jgi:filamentous hemagglutinin
LGAGHNSGRRGRSGYYRLVGAKATGTKGVSPVVTAEGRIGGTTFTDFNQTARPASQANASQPTLISDRVTAKADASGKVLPNGNMADAHAEIGVIQQAYAAGKTMGASMELTVSGKAVCGYCRGDIAAMAEKSGLTSLAVKEVATGKTLYWQPGMRALRERG